MQQTTTTAMVDYDAVEAEKELMMAPKPAENIGGGDNDT